MVAENELGGRAPMPMIAQGNAASLEALPPPRILSSCWSDVWPAAEALMLKHHEETSEGLPFKVDVAAAAAMDAAGALSITALRSQSGLLQGYIFWYLMRNLESADVLIASQGPWYVLPELRSGGSGLRLFRESLKALRSRGVKQVYPHRWLRSGGEALERFFLRLGAKELERTYSLWIGD